MSSFVRELFTTILKKNFRLTDKNFDAIVSTLGVNKEAVVERCQRFVIFDFIL